MSIGDCIQINDNEYYTNSNVVVHYGNLNCNTGLRLGNNLVYENTSCQNFPKIKPIDNESPSDYIVGVISHPRNDLDENEFKLISKKDSLIKIPNNSNHEEKSTRVNQKLLQRGQNKTLVFKTSENTSLNSKFDDKTVNEMFICKESSGKKCKVCFDKAVNQNFGVLSCESCKAFFRRNAIRTSPLKCSNGTDSCSVTSSTRKQCPSCRLKKCFQVGMKSELIQIRKNNPKINLGKRKSNTISQDGVQTKWTTQSTNCSNSSGRLSQENIDEIVKINDINLISNMSENSPLISAGLWINTTNCQYQINNQQNFWLPMNIDQQCNSDSLSCNLLPTSSIAPINNQSFAQTFNPIKYDVQIPMIEIKTHHNIIQPIAVLPTTSTSIYETLSTMHTIYSNDMDQKSIEFPKDAIIDNKMLTYSDMPAQNIYQYGLSNYSNDQKPSIGDNNISAFYPFTMQPNVTSSQPVYFNGVGSANINSYLMEFPHQSSESSVSNELSHSFMSIDSGSEVYFCNPTYSESCNSSQNMYLSPERLELMDSNPCFSSIHEDENIGNEDYPEILLSDDIQLVNSRNENIMIRKSFLLSDRQSFIIEIGKIWESTLGRIIVFPNPNNVKPHVDLRSPSSNSLKLSKKNSNSENWINSFVRLSDIFIRQINIFLDKIIDTCSYYNKLGESLMSELTKIKQNESNEKILLIIIPIIFSNLITRFSSNENSRFPSDKETRDFLFPEQSTNSDYQDSLDNPTIYFSVTCRNPIDNSVNTVDTHIDLTLLSNRFFELDNVKYSSLQYLDKYCSGLSNFLSPTPVFYGLFSLLKIMAVWNKEEYSDLNWNRALLRRESSPKGLTGNLSKLIYNLKSIFVTACDIVQTDTVEQRLFSLDQFLTWSKSQFDLQWMDFFISTISQEQFDINDYQFI